MVYTMVYPYRTSFKHIATHSLLARESYDLKLRIVIWELTSQPLQLIRFLISESAATPGALRKHAPVGAIVHQLLR